MDSTVAPKYATREEIESLLEQTRAEATRDKKARKPKKRLTKAQKIRKIVLNALYLVLVFALLAMLYLSLQSKADGKLPSLFGYYVFTVRTGSMVPTLPIGSYILSHTPDDPALIGPDTIVTFYQEDGTVVTHRIIERNVAEDGSVSYVTKGDNANNAVDPEALTPDRVISEFVFVFTLPRLWSPK